MQNGCFQAIQSLKNNHLKLGRPLLKRLHQQSSPQIRKEERLVRHKIFILRQRWIVSGRRWIRLGGRSSMAVRSRDTVWMLPFLRRSLQHLSQFRDSQIQRTKKHAISVTKLIHENVNSMPESFIHDFRRSSSKKVLRLLYKYIVIA